MAEARYTHRSGFFSFAQLRYTGSFFADDANAVGVDAYNLVNLRLGYDRRFAFGKLSVFLGADNMFGVDYFNNVRLNAGGGRYFEPGAGRILFVGLSFQV